MKQPKTKKAKTPAATEAKGDMMQSRMALQQLLLCAITEPKDIAGHCAIITMELLAHTVLQTGSVEKSLQVISDGINIAAKPYAVSQ